MTATEENYVHYAECCDCLNRAWRILQDLSVVGKKGAIHDAAFRFALIEYAKPYTTSDGTHKSGRRAYRLAVPNLTPEDMALHEVIAGRRGLRNRILAHSDLTLKEATVSLARFEGRPNVCVAQNIPGALPDPEAVIRLIENTLTLMYAEKARLVEALAQKA